jgi:hypothetical protein
MKRTLAGSSQTGLQNRPIPPVARASRYTRLPFKPDEEKPPQYTHRQHGAARKIPVVAGLLTEPRGRPQVSAISRRWTARIGDETTRATVGLRDCAGRACALVQETCGRG